MRPTLSSLLLTFALVALTACEVGSLGDTTGPGDDDDDTPLDCEPPFPPTDPASLDECCELFGGKAHCVPDDIVPTEVAEFTADCDGGGQCIPDPFIQSGGVFELRACTFHLDGTPGKCLSACVPQVQDNIALLRQDVCELDDFCVPCISPLDGLPTGVCEIDFSCQADDPDDDPPPPPDAVCPYEGPPIIDPASFSACTTCGGAHCVPNALVPAAFADRLGACDTTAKCVPDEFIVSAGNTIPDTCVSVAGAEGRCLSRCLPEVIEQEALLPQSTCAATAACVPCFNPLDGLETGACGLSCDPGPTQPPVVLPKCCDGRGTCVPPEAAGDQADQLGEDTCPEDGGLLCAPDDIIAGTFVAAPCTTGGLIGGGAPGACLPDCLGAVDTILVSQGTCVDGYKCAPCEGPFGGDTGACDYLPPGT